MAGPCAAVGLQPKRSKGQPLPGDFGQLVKVSSDKLPSISQTRLLTEPFQEVPATARGWLASQRITSCGRLACIEAHQSFWTKRWILLTPSMFESGLTRSCERRSPNVWPFPLTWYPRRELMLWWEPGWMSRSHCILLILWVAVRLKLWRARIKLRISRVIHWKSLSWRFRGCKIPQKLRKIILRDLRNHTSVSRPSWMK